MEGPSLVILKEELAFAVGKKISAVKGNTKKFDVASLKGRKIQNILSHGKHLIIVFDDFFVRIHFLMFGSYRINDRKDREPRLQLVVGTNEINFYSCSVIKVEHKPESVYDFETDVMSEEFSARKALNKLKKRPDEMICDILMDQNIFSGTGNIIKNEVLYRCRLHPEHLIRDMTTKKMSEVIKQNQLYSYDFYEWKKLYELRKHWQVYKKIKCPNCERKLEKRPTGKGKRRSFFCEYCQK